MGGPLAALGAVAGLTAARFVEAAGAAPPVPELGLVGERALREAFAGDYMQLGNLLRGAVREHLKLTAGDDVYAVVRAVFTDHLVIERDGAFWRYAYTVDGASVSFGAPERVVQTYAPATAGDPMREAAPVNPQVAQLSGAFLEAASGGRFRIRLIKAGPSGNANYYSDTLLREAAPLFEGARVFVKSDAEHLAGKGKDVRNLVGGITKVAFVEGTAGPDSGELQGDLTFLEADGAIARQVKGAHEAGLSGLFGFSIDANGVSRPKRIAGKAFREAVKFTKVHSVDLIVEPGAGGGVISFIEAQRGEDEGKDTMWRERLIEALKQRGVKDVDTMTDEQLETAFKEAIAAPTPTPPGPQGGGLTKAEVEAMVRMVEARAAARAAIAASPLPQPAKDRLTGRFTEAAAFTDADVTKAIEDEKSYLAHFTESGTVRGLGGGRVQGEDRFAKLGDMLDAFWDPAHKDHRHARSFKECYREITGDDRVTGLRAHCDEARLREALGTGDLSDLLGDSIRRRMVADYNIQAQYDVWRRVATVSSAADFRSNERTRFGGYGDLPVVAQSGAYQPLTSPSDEKASFAVAKRGGTETLTLEAIKNDDVGLIRRIPTNLSRAAKRTLGKFVLDFIRTNPAIYDGLTLFHATHGNLGTAALSSAALAAGRLAMLQQTEPGSDEPLFIPPRSLLVPAELEETAVDLFRRNTEQDKTFIQSLTLDVLPVWYWTDSNDWALAADPVDIPTIEVAFLDGDEEPSLFVQDSPTGGSMFSNDQLTWKIRHIYGGTVLDYRGFYKAVVT